MAVRPYKSKSGQLIRAKWVIDYYDSNGKRHQFIFEGPRDEAEATEVDLRKRHSRGPLKNPTINQIIPEYLTWMRNHRAERTVKDIELCLKKILPHFGPCPVNRITRQMIETYITARKTAGRVSSLGKRLGEIKPSGINKELNYLSSIISWMAANDYCYPLPFKIPKLKSRRPLPQVPSPERIEEFIAALRKNDPKKGLLAAMIYDSGFRWEEIANLKWGDINWQTGDIIITGKGDKQRLQILSERCRAWLEPLRENKNKGLIFKNPKTGRAYTSLRKIWEKTGQKLGFKINPHLLRHAWATYTLEATGDVRLVQEGLGHRDIATTQIYTHISKSRLRAGAQQRQEYLEKQAKNENTVNYTANQNGGKVIDITQFFKRRS